MSKIGKAPITIPAWVEVTINGKEVKVKGSKWELSYTLVDWVDAQNQDGQVVITVNSEEIKNLWGLTRTLIANMVEGVMNGFSKSLTVIGVGYGAKLQGKDLVFQLWFSHPVLFNMPAWITASVDKDAKGNNVIKIEGIDKQLVGEVASKIKLLKKPEPYKGKGIRYTDEIIKLKPGKASK